jgi:hypothetical protein
MHLRALRLLLSRSYLSRNPALSLPKNSSGLVSGLAGADRGYRSGGAGMACRLGGMMLARAVATGLPDRLEYVHDAAVAAGR